jgi:two-component system response regulator (stage 0 sporulation protein A)
MEKFDLEVIAALRELEIPAHMKGYEYIKTAMSYLREKPDAIYAITKELYPAVAERHNTTGSRVERGIRHALENAGSDYLTQKKVIGTARELTNGEFLATFAEVMRVKMAGVA